MESPHKPQKPTCVCVCVCVDHPVNHSNELLTMFTQAVVCHKIDAMAAL